MRKTIALKSSRKMKIEIMEIELLYDWLFIVVYIINIEDKYNLYCYLNNHFHVLMS